MLDVKPLGCAKLNSVFYKIHRMKKICVSLLPAILWAITIFILSAVPGDKLYMPPIWNADKFAHIAVYFVLSASLIFGFLRIGYCKSFIRQIFMAITISVVFGGILEILQQHIFIGRFGDILDFVANSTGAILAGFIAFLFRNRILKICL